jgi:glycine/D-amino acid oxidase-like deaminating enzyme
VKIAIVGAGIAGLSLCEWLLDINCEITLIDSNDSLMGSNAPTILFHPFPGRSLELHPNLQDATNSTVQILERWKILFPDFIRSTRMIRPLLGNNESRLRKSYETNWKNKTTDWLQFDRWSAQKIHSIDPGFNQNFDAITYTPAYAVDYAELRVALIKNFQSRGVSYVQTSIETIQKDNRWLLPKLSDNFESVVLATGNSTSYWFPSLRITLQGGSLLHAKTDFRTKNLISVNGLHIGSHSDGNLVVGSTRWTSLPTSNSQIIELQKRVREQFPNIPPLKTKAIWHGVRCIYPSDRFPLCGELPHCRGVFVITALGSKGLLWGPHAAKQLRNNICYGTSTSAVFSLDRASPEDGWFSPNIHY